MRPTPAGRGGTARCCSPYNAILERLDTMDARIQQAVDDANAAMSAAVIQAGNAAQSASDALTQAGIAAGKASDAAADAADAAQDAADAAQALSDINDTISTVLNSTLGDKVDKLTTAGLHLYSHTGATQSEEEPIDGTTANSIPIRDGNGRMQAADPASGATDKTLVTANWVSQTGDSAPNNLVHKSGTETIQGTKRFTYSLEEQTGINGGSSPATYTSNYGRFRVVGADLLPIIGVGFEKSSGGVNSTRLVLNINANTDPGTGRQPSVQIHFIMDETNGTLKMQPAHVDKNNVRTFGSAIDLMSWTP